MNKPGFFFSGKMKTSLSPKSSFEPILNLPDNFCRTSSKISRKLFFSFRSFSTSKHWIRVSKKIIESIVWSFLQTFRSSETFETSSESLYSFESFEKFSETNPTKVLDTSLLGRSMCNSGVGSLKVKFGIFKFLTVQLSVLDLSGNIIWLNSLM